MAAISRGSRIVTVGVLFWNLAEGSTVQLQHPFGVITPTVDGDVLAVLAGADAVFTSGDVARLAEGEWSRSGVRRSLDRLVEQGIVDVARVGAGYSFSLNRDHLAAQYIIALANLRATLVQRIGAVLESARQPLVWAAMFGSAARAEMTPTSDIDIFLVCRDSADSETWGAWSGDLAAMISRWTGNDTRLLEMTQSEVEAGAASGDPVLVSIATDALPLFGETAWLRRRVKKRRKTTAR